MIEELLDSVYLKKYTAFPIYPHQNFPPLRKRLLVLPDVENELEKLHLSLIQKYKHSTLRDSFLSFSSKNFVLSSNGNKEAISEQTNLVIFSREITTLKEIESCQLFLLLIMEFKF